MSSAPLRAVASIDRPRDIADERRIAYLACGPAGAAILELAELRAAGDATVAPGARGDINVVRGGRDLLVEGQHENGDCFNYWRWEAQAAEARGDHEEAVRLRAALHYLSQAFNVAESIRLDRLADLEIKGAAR